MVFLSLSRQPVLLFIAVHHFKGGPMAGVYGSSLPPSVLHASMLPSPKRAGAFVVEGEVKTCKGL